MTLAPSNPDIVWVGTGDAFTSRSSYAGDGVYKSTDGGKSWRNMGLGDSHHIARIVIHPTDPDVVYVAAMGHLYSENEERGVFKTTDGGESWEKVFYLDDEGRCHRPGHEPGESGRPLRRHLRQGAAPLDACERRP